MPVRSKEAEVSIVIATYNCEKFLPYMIHSCRTQDFEGVIEVIIVDDGSTDDTLSILSQIKSQLECERFRITFHSQENRGVASARNKGILLSQAKKILFLDADDAYAPETVRICAKTLNAHPNTGLIYSDTLRCDQNLKPLYVNRKPNYNLRELLSRNCIGQIRAFHKQVLEAVGGFDTSYIPAEDYDLTLRVALDSRFAEPVHIPAALYWYRANPQGLIANANGRQWIMARAALQAAFDRMKLNVEVPEATTCADGYRRFIYPESFWLLLRKRGFAV